MLKGIMDFVIPPVRIVRYLRNRSTDLKACENYFKDQDYESIKKITHQIRGSARTFGFEELESIAINLEEAALKTDSIQIQNCLNQWKTWQDLPRVSEINN